MKWLWLGLFAMLVVATVFAVATDGHQRSRLMEACLADGHQEYECVGILRGGR